MKILVLVTVALLLSGTEASGFVDTLKGLFSGIGETFTNLFNNLKGPLVQIGAGLLQQLKNGATALLATGAQSLLGSLQGTATPAPARRDIGLVTKVTQFFQNGKDMITKLSANLVGLFHAAMSKLSDLGKEITSFDFLKQPLSEILEKITHVVASHNIFQDTVVQDLLKNPGQFILQAAEHMIGDLVKSSKRSAIGDTLSSIGQSLANLFGPVVNQLKQHVTNLGHTLATAASNLFQSITPSLNQLAGKLSGHIQTLTQAGQELLGHGVHALSALTSAVGDIMGQTFANAKPALHTILSTGTDALKVTTDHIVHALGGTSTNSEQ